MRFEADPLVGRIECIVVVVRRPQIFLRLSKETFGLRRLRVGAVGGLGIAGVVLAEVLSVSLPLLLVLLGPLVHLVEEELVGLGEVLLERTAAAERIARIEVELARIEAGWPGQAQLETLQFGLDVLGDDGSKLLVADVLVGMPAQEQSLDDLAPLVLRQLPSFFQCVADLFHDLFGRYDVLLVARLVLSTLRSSSSFVGVIATVFWLLVLVTGCSSRSPFLVVLADVGGRVRRLLLFR